jgi:hypothetical protein
MELQIMLQMRDRSIFVETSVDGRQLSRACLTPKTGVSDTPVFDTQTGAPGGSGRRLGLLRRGSTVAQPEPEIV